MRPHSLTVRGFRSYADPITFDFSERRLVGVVGPIGAGKSSMLDAMSFALYGQTPTVARDTKSLVNQRRDAAHVELVFSVDREVWRSVRVLRRKGASAHYLERLDGAGEAVEKIEGEKAVTARVTSLLGMDFGVFRHAVLLAQNEFAAFLSARPGQRDDVLKAVFGLERVDAMWGEAKQRLAAVTQELADLERLRKDLEADRSRLREIEAALAPQGERVERLEEVARQAAVLAEAVREGQAQHTAAAAELDRLHRLSKKLPAERDVYQITSKQSELDEAVAVSQRAVADATEHAAEAEKSLAEVVSRWGDHAALTEATVAVEQRRHLAAAQQQAEAASTEAEKAVQEADAALGAATAALAEAQREMEAALAEEAKAVASVDEAEQAAHRARHADMAAALRAGLESGDVCPVCEQEIGGLVASEASGVEEAERRLEDARIALQEVRQRAQTARQSAAQREAAVNAHRLGLDDAKARSAKAAADAAAARRRVDEADAAIGKDAPDQWLGDWKTALDTASARRDQAVASVETARRRLEQAVAARQDLDERLRAVQSVLSQAAGTLEIEDPPERAAELHAVVVAALSARSDAAEERAKQALAAAEEAASSRLTLLREAEVDGEIDAALSRARDRLVTLRTQAAELVKRLERLASLEKDNAALIARHDVLRRLADDLAPSRFQRFLLDEDRDELSRVGSERFEQLSAGRYRFSDDGRFDVVDLAAADAVRPAGSLSGGETFLASLALALSLADLAARRGGRIDAFFLDEGFGSLDPEHLDLAMDGIERLAAAGDRLVIVVSHVPAMRRRFEDVIALGKDPVTGDTALAS